MLTIHTPTDQNGGRNRLYMYVRRSKGIKKQIMIATKGRTTILGCSFVPSSSNRGGDLV